MVPAWIKEGHRTTKRKALFTEHLRHRDCSCDWPETTPCPADYAKMSATPNVKTAPAAICGSGLPLASPRTDGKPRAPEPLETVDDQLKMFLAWRRFIERDRKFEMADLARADAIFHHVTWPVGA